MTIHCEIVSQDRIVFQGDVNMVVLPGVEGDMGILPNHSPLLSVLRFGIVTVKTKEGPEKDQHFTVAGGIAEVQPDQITILADAAENVHEIDIQRAEAARKRAEELLENGVRENKDEFDEIQAALIRSKLRLDAVRRFKQSQRINQ